jgi:hypothetical protein
MKRFSALLVITLTTTGCDFLSGTVRDHYATLADAKADRLFERGWLPEILPASATNIKTVNNLDISTSTGEFHFAVSDGPSLFGKLTAGAPTDSQFAEWPSTVKKYTRRGFASWRYRDQGTTWAFFCIPSEGTCEYFAWQG